MTRRAPVLLRTTTGTIARWRGAAARTSMGRITSNSVRNNSVFMGFSFPLVFAPCYDTGSARVGTTYGVEAPLPSDSPANLRTIKDA
jgi:hypothetical protein